MSEETKEETREIVKRCPECNEYLANITSGAVCLKGHGGLFPKVDRITDMRANGKVVPIANETSLKHNLGGKDGIATDSIVYMIDSENPGFFMRVNDKYEAGKEETVVEAELAEKLKKFLLIEESLFLHPDYKIIWVMPEDKEDSGEEDSETENEESEFEKSENGESETEESEENLEVTS